MMAGMAKQVARADRAHDLIEHYALTADSTDGDIADAAARHLLADYSHYNGHMPPYKLAMDWNAKKERPPVPCNWVSGKQCGVGTIDYGVAFDWIRSAVLWGVVVRRLFGQRDQWCSDSISIESVRQRIAWRSRYKDSLAKIGDIDDEIPF